MEMDTQSLKKAVEIFRMINPNVPINEVDGRKVAAQCNGCGKPFFVGDNFQADEIAGEGIIAWCKECYDPETATEMI